MPISPPGPGGAPQPPRRKVPRPEREAQMIASAIEVFSKRGYDGASMDEIAKGAGITKPMVYAYFGSKQGLLAACIDRTASPMVESFEHDINRSLPPDEQLWQGICGYLSFVQQHRQWWSAIYLEAASGAGEPAAAVERVRASVAAVFSRMIGEHAQATMPAAQNLLIARALEPVARAFVGAAEALAAWWLEHPSEERDMLAICLMNLTWRGFEQLTEGRFWLPREGRLGSVGPAG
ncbi:MAG: TetR/AcrR family transcriptional regulator [Solirubrobacterales bacterium]